MKQIYIYIFISLIFVSCGRKSASTDEIIVDISKGKQLSFVSQLNQIRFIPLESTDYSNIGRIQLIRLFENKIILADSKTQKVLIFNMQGKFLLSIHKVGKGPGEYIKITDLQINEKNGNIVILDEAQYKMLEFDFSGNLVHEIKIPIKEPLSNFAFIDSNTVVLNKSFIRADNENSILVCSNDFKKINYLLPSKKTTSLLISPRVSFQKTNDCLLHLPIYSQKLYHVKANEIKEKYVFNFGENNIDLNLYNHNYSNPFDFFKKLKDSNSIYFFNALESETDVYADFYYKEVPYFCIYKKQTKQTNVFYDDRMKKMGDSFYPYTTKNGKYVSIVEAAHLNEFPNHILSSNKLDKITSEDNPVIIIFQFKK